MDNATIRLTDGRDVRRMTMVEIAAEYAAIRAECPYLIRLDRSAVGAAVAVDRRRAARVSA